MIKKLTALAALVLLLLTQRPHAQGPAGTANIYFVDIGQGASTLVVSPTGKTLLVDGGADGSATKIAALMTTLGITTIDYSVVTHYHIDHISGITELINGGKVHGTAFDNGDGADVQPPGTSTSPASTRGHYLDYKSAILAHPEVTRATVMPGTPDSVLDLGGGMRATFLAAGGRLLSGGQAAITNADLNSESISVLVELNNFDYLVSGDLTGGGSTATAKTPDVETYVAQMVGDVDVVQLDHHGSTTANNQTFLAALKAEVAFAQTGENNMFGHPNRETANKYLNTPTTGGNSFAGTDVPPALGIGPVFYQNEASPSGDDRVTHQGYTGAAAGHAGQGTILLSTDGTTTYSLSSVDDGGARLNATAHTYPVDGASPGLTIDFKPTVQAQTAPVLPAAGQSVIVSAAVNDRESSISSVVLNYSLSGSAQSPIAMTFTSGAYQATIPGQPDGTRVDYAIAAAAGGQTTTYSSGYFSGVTPISSIRDLNAAGEPLYAGYAARIQGMVTASGYSSGTNDDYVQDATGGVNVYRSTDTPTPFTSTSPGQLVLAFGRIGFNGGRLRLDLTESLEKTTSPYGVTVLAANPPPTPVTMTIAAINANPESFEGQFVSISNCTIVSGSIPATPQPVDTFVTISDGTGSFVLKVDHDTDVEGFTPAPTFTVTGIIQQDDFLRPFDSGYDIAPRSRTDLGAAAPAPPTLVTIGDARIDQVNNADGTPGGDFIPDRLNQVVRVQGTVTSIDFRGGNGIEYYVQDATGGIDLFSTSLNAGPFAIGDTVEATGAVTQFNGLTELTVSAVSFIATGSAPAPAVVTLSQLASGNGEAFEGQLIRIDNVAITSGLFPAAGSSGNVTIADATGTGTLRVDSDTNIDGTATPATVFSVTGVLGQFSAAPFDSGYQLLPRLLTDIVASGGGGPALTALPGTLAFPATTVGSASVAPVSITNNGTTTLTLTTPFTLTGADASQFQAGAPGTTTLDPGTSTTASITFLPTTAGTKSATLTIASTAGSTTVALSGTGQTAGGGGGVVISEIRFRGPLGGNDEFVEIYNNSDNSSDISGWKLMGSSNTAPTGTRATVGAGVILPARAHYLFVNTAASGYSGATPPNSSYTTGFADNGGAALTDTANVIIDQVGVQTTGTAYKEGTPLPTLLTTNVDRGYQRKPGTLAVTLQDTNDNNADFQQTSPSGPQNIVLTAAPSGVDFGSVGPGDTRSQIVTIKNVLLNAVTLTAPFAITGAGATSFSVGAPSTISIAPGATATVAVTFQPASSGAKTASLAITSTLAGSILVPLTGTATAGLFVSPTSVDFGTVAPGSNAAATVTITNTDATSITLTPPFAIAGADAADFGAGAPGVSVLPAGEATSIALSFQPAASGIKNATLQITSAGSGPRTVALSGVGTCPSITLAGTLPGGRVASAYAGIVTASGDPGPFTFTLSGGSLPSGLLLGASGAVSGTPIAEGSSTFSVQATAANGCSGSASFTIAVAPPALTASPSTIDFGVVAVPGQATQPITLTNNTAGPITLTTPFAITGANAAQFSVGAPAAVTLAGGASTEVAVTFTPSAAGMKNATLTATSTGGGFATVLSTGAGAAATPVVISEIRFHGPLGGNDELVEIYNNTDAPIDISGWKLMGSSNTAPTTTRATVPAATILPARMHYLFVNTAASGYSGVVPGNVAYTTGFGDNGGVALTTPDTTIVDQVGIQTTGTAYREGAPIATQLTTSVDRGYERKPGHASLALQDTDTNALDFALVTPTNAQSLGLTLTAATLDFGNVNVTEQASLDATIKNNLLATVTLTPPFTIAGTNSAEFTVGSPATTSLAGGATTTVSITFGPTSPGAKSASIQIASSGGGSPTATLSGLGTPGISVSPGAIDFGSTAVGSSSLSTLTITNDNPTDVTLTPPFVITGTDAANFSVGATAVSTLAAGDSTSIAVTFSPAALAGKSASLSITSSNGGARSVALSGVGACPAITVSGSLPTAEFGSAYTGHVTASGGSGPYTFAITNGALPNGLLLDATSGAVSGTPTALGASPFTVGATLGNGCSGTADFSVSVGDTTTPTLMLPANITTEATGATTIVSFGVSASDVADPALVVGCVPASGFAFPVAATTVNCNATDASRNVAHGSFTVSVTDNTAPTISVVATVTTEATGPLTPLTFDATATDIVDGPVAVNCTPSSGSGVPVGTTTVDCNATDAHNNNASATFTVSVTDHTAPTLTLPGDVSAEATGPSGAAVSYSASASDIVDGPRPVSCAPASGSTFPIGTTTVVCSAGDAHANASSGSFTVTIGTIDQPGRMTGDGAIEIGTVKHAFDFRVNERANGPDSTVAGDLRYRVKTKKPHRDAEDRFDATAISSVTFFNVPGMSPGRRPPSGIDTVSFVGAGTWNGRAGYTFEAIAVDAGEPGRGRDSFAITIRSATGQIISSVNAAITQGNVQSLRILR